MKSKRRKKKKKVKKKPRYPHDRLEGDPPLAGTQWLNQVNRTLGPTDSGTPGGLGGMSAMPEATIAWMRMNCKFARTDNDQNPVRRTILRDDGEQVREA